MPHQRALFPFLLLASGFCGISYEILYGRILGNLIGDQFLVSASVLLTFLLGIGLGGYFAHRLWAHLWLLEAGIGLYGALFAVSSGLLDALLYSDLPLARSGLSGPLVLCILLLITPAFLIGSSLPIFAGYLKCLSPDSVFSSAYALYNLGAAVTVLSIEFWLIRSVGIRLATLSIAVLNGLVSFSLCTEFRRLRSQNLEEPKKERTRFRRGQLLALALASTGSAIYQLLMTKLAEAFIGPFRETFALVLCITLFGIALGSALTKRFRTTLPELLFANLVGLVWTLAGFGQVMELYATYWPLAAETHLGSVVLKLSALTLLMGVPSVTFGATIPVLITAQGNVIKDSGQLLFVSSLANAFGFLLMALYLHQRFDYGVLLIITTLLVATALVLYRRKLDYRTPLGIILVLVTVYVHRAHWDEELLYYGHRAFLSAEDLEAERKSFDRPETFKGPVDGASEEAPIHYYRGRAHEGLGEIAEALDAYREALDSDPDYERARAALSRLER